MLTTPFGDRVVVAGGIKFPSHRDQVVELLQALLNEAKSLPSESYVGISINMTTREEALRSKSQEILLPQGDYIEMHLFKAGSPHDVPPSLEHGPVLVLWSGLRNEQQCESQRPAL